MTFVTKPDGTADNFANEVSNGLGQTDQRKSGGGISNAHAHGTSSVDKLISHSKKLGFNDSESTAY